MWQGSSCISSRFLAFPVKTKALKPEPVSDYFYNMKQEVELHLRHHRHSAGGRCRGGGRRAGQGRRRDRFGHRCPPCRDHCLGLLRGGHLHRHRRAAGRHCDGLLGKDRPQTGCDITVTSLTLKRSETTTSCRVMTQETGNTPVQWSWRGTEPFWSERGTPGAQSEEPADVHHSKASWEIRLQM